MVVDGQGGAGEFRFATCSAVRGLNYDSDKPALSRAALDEI